MSCRGPDRPALIAHPLTHPAEGLKRMFSAQQRFSRHIHKYAADCATINAKVARVLRASGHDGMPLCLALPRPLCAC